MISTEELVYEFKLALNKVNRQDNVNIPIEDIIVYLNQAQISWVKTKLNPNNIYRAGYEAIRKRIDDLQVLKKDNIELKPVKTNDQLHIGYNCSLEDAENYMFYINSYSKAIKNTCSGILTHDLIRSGDLTTRYLNVNYSPSFEWRTTLVTLGDNNLTVYTDGTFEIDSVFINYLRYPKRIDITGYLKLDNTQSINQDCELPEYAKSDIVDLAVKFAAQANDNQAQSVFAEDRLIKNSE
jgi:hypothetical protein